MAFQWKDRAGAVCAAAYQYKLCRERIEQDFRALPPEQLQAYRDIHGYDLKPTEALHVALRDCTDLVLGTGGRFLDFRDYFCTGVEDLSHRRYLKFRHDVEKHVVKSWDVDTKLLKDWEVQVVSA